MALPACEASIAQVPEAISETVVPETVQTVCVVEVKLTGRPEESVALSVRVVPAVCVAMEPKSIVWLLGDPPLVPDDAAHPANAKAIVQRIRENTPPTERRIVLIESPTGGRTDFKI